MLSLVYNELKIVYSVKVPQKQLAGSWRVHGSLAPHPSINQFIYPSTFSSFYFFSFTYTILIYLSSFSSSLSLSPRTLVFFIFSLPSPHSPLLYLYFLHLTPYSLSLFRLFLLFSFLINPLFTHFLFSISDSSFQLKLFCLTFYSLFYLLCISSCIRLFIFLYILLFILSLGYLFLNLERNWVFMTNFEFYSLYLCNPTFEAMNSVRSFGLSWKYQRFTQSGFKHWGTSKFEFYFN